MAALLHDFRERKGRNSTLRLDLIIMIGVFFLLIPLPAEAQLSDCQGIQGEGYKVLLDGLSYSQDIFQTDKDLRIFMDRLSWKLQTKRESILTESRTLRSVIVTCPQRRPADGSEFGKNIVDALNSRDVVLRKTTHLRTRHSFRCRRPRGATSCGCSSASVAISCELPGSWESVATPSINCYQG